MVMVSHRRPGMVIDLAAFADTRWSQVRRLGADTPSGRAALAWLSAVAWEPLCRHAQRRGLDRAAAEDAVQSFLARILEHGLGQPDPVRGRFRTWLLAAFWHFLADQADRAAAIKRGGRRDHATLSSVNAASAADPEFDHDWARTVLARVLDQLAIGQDAVRYAVLRPFLAGSPAPAAIAEAARRLDLHPGAVRVAVHRLRQRFSALLRAEVVESVDDEEVLDDELKLLAAALAERV